MIKKFKLFEAENFDTNAKGIAIKTPTQFKIEFVAEVESEAKMLCKKLMRFVDTENQLGKYKDLISAWGRFENDILNKATDVQNVINAVNERIQKCSDEDICKEWKDIKSRLEKLYMELITFKTQSGSMVKQYQMMLDTYNGIDKFIRNF